MKNIYKNTYKSKEVGKMGESTASHYLKIKGHTILGQNIRLGRGEIDILSKKDGVLHVVEVKTHTGRASIKAEENITPLKKRRLTLLASTLLSQYGSKSPLFSSLESDVKTERGMVLRDSPPIQIDVIAVRLRFVGKQLKSAFVRYYQSIC
jgi:putative endonuclease